MRCLIEIARCSTGYNAAWILFSGPECSANDCHSFCQSGSLTYEQSFIKDCIDTKVCAGYGHIVQYADRRLVHFGRHDLHQEVQVCSTSCQSALQNEALHVETFIWMMSSSSPPPVLRPATEKTWQKRRGQCVGQPFETVHLKKSDDTTRSKHSAKAMMLSDSRHIVISMALLVSFSLWETEQDGWVYMVQGSKQWLQRQLPWLICWRESLRGVCHNACCQDIFYKPPESFRSCRVLHAIYKITKQLLIHTLYDLALLSARIDKA